MKCVQCGNEFSGNTCPNCGYNAAQTQAGAQQPVMPQQQLPLYQTPVTIQQQPKKKLAWWKIAIGAVVILVLIVACFGNGSSDGEKTGGTGNKTTQSAASGEKTDEQSAESQKNTEKEADKSEGALGDYYVKILSAKVTKDYDKKPAIVITYEFTNNSDKATSFSLALYSQAYQDGIELDPAIIMDSKVYNSSNSLKDIKPGKTIKAQRAFLLDNKKSDVEIEVSESFSFSDEKVVKTFEIKK